MRAIFPATTSFTGGLAAASIARFKRASAVSIAVPMASNFWLLDRIEFLLASEKLEVAEEAIISWVIANVYN
jgi:hypothetical protein